ncbi:MAG: 30S ribosomal protein S16 [Candidatus Paceibacterota bacterium]|nr:MAG: 30S ribosomal protein S16 [Candidatus Paceibacterota bacterium]
MLKIRLQRVGRKHEPVFRLVLTDSKNGPKSGKFLEILGNYDSRRGEDFKFDGDRIKYWISKGAQTSGTVHNLLISKSLFEGKKINVLPKKKPIKKDQPEAQSTSSVSESPDKKESESPVQNSEPSPTPDENSEQETSSPEKTEETASAPSA